MVACLVPIERKPGSLASEAGMFNDEVQDTFWGSCPAPVKCFGSGTICFYHAVKFRQQSGFLLTHHYLMIKQKRIFLPTFNQNRIPTGQSF